MSTSPPHIPALGGSARLRLLMGCIHPRLGDTPTPNVEALPTQHGRVPFLFHIPSVQKGTLPCWVGNASALGVGVSPNLGGRQPINSRRQAGPPKAGICRGNADIGQWWGRKRHLGEVTSGEGVADGVGWRAHAGSGGGRLEDRGDWIGTCSMKEAGMGAAVSMEADWVYEIKKRAAQGQPQCTDLPACAGSREGSDHLGLLYTAFPCISARGCFQDLNP
jgi:hypothetical protein